MGFRKAFATVSFSILRLVQDTVSRTCTLTPSPALLTLFVLLLCIRRTRPSWQRVYKWKMVERQTFSVSESGAVLPAAASYSMNQWNFSGSSVHRYLYAQPIFVSNAVRSVYSIFRPPHYYRDFISSIVYSCNLKFQWAARYFDGPADVAEKFLPAFHDEPVTRVARVFKVGQF